jgi:mono/diheme cytochrome c family protein
MRTPSSVVGLTEWIPAGDFLLFAGAFSFWLFGFTSHATGNGTERRGDASMHLGLSAIGLVLAVVSMWMAGLATGLSWAAGVNAGTPTSFGEGWSVIDEILSPFLAVRALGTVLFAIAQIVFVYTVFAASWREPELLRDIDGEAFDLQLRSESGSMSRGHLRLGIIATFGIALLLTVVIPALDPSVGDATIVADEARTYPDGSAAADGRAVYLQENCLACHTQSVRPIVTDVGLGPVSVAGDFVHDTPPLIGTERLGPDLMHIGTRLDDEGVEAVKAHLKEPRASRPWSIMPSYRYLSDRDLDVLAEYLLSLR